MAASGAKADVPFFDSQHRDKLVECDYRKTSFGGGLASRWDPCPLDNRYLTCDLHYLPIK